MKIIVLGSTGMLGRYVYKYISSQNFNTNGINRDKLNAENCSRDNICENIKDANIVVNCIGLIKPQVDLYGTEAAIRVNSLFPHMLASVCKDLNIKLIHITTDCVFSGKHEGYDEESIHDAQDIYGKTKSLGEPLNCTVIRTSIIGEEKENTRSLVEWIKSNANQTISGYQNHIWNGVTCLQLAKIINWIINSSYYWHGVRHIFSDPITKYELLKIVNDIYQLNINILSVNSTVSCNRTLISKYDTYKLVPRQPLYNQIQELNKYDFTI